MPFTSQNYGTFTGPQSILGDYIYDITALEGTWPTEIPVDTTFKLTDIAAVFFQNPLNYSGFHLYGVVPDFVVLERNTGFIPTFMANIANTIHNGNIIVNGATVLNGATVANGLVSVNGAVTIFGSAVLAGVGDVASRINANTVAIADKKSFDIPHPTKEGYRLRHVCVEGPEDGPIYVRGKLEEGNVIKLPDYWDGLVDKESISVNLTPIGMYQELFVEKIEWGKNVIVKNNTGGSVKCYYQIWAARKYDDKLHVEYKGDTPADYPGDNTRFSIAGYDYDRR